MPVRGVRLAVCCACLGSVSPILFRDGIDYVLGVRACLAVMGPSLVAMPIACGACLNVGPLSGRALFS